MSPSKYNNSDHAEFWMIYHEEEYFLNAFPFNREGLEDLIDEYRLRRRVLRKRVSMLSGRRCDARTKEGQWKQQETARRMALTLRAASKLVPRYFAAQILILEREFWGGDHEDEAWIRGLKLAEALEVYNIEKEAMEVQEKVMEVYQLKNAGG
ncbi:MAG: hypothetical protein Q9169_006496 [Polycauliona sp. 2 TL-2023]